MSNKAEIILAIAVIAIAVAVGYSFGRNSSIFSYPNSTSIISTSTQSSTTSINRYGLLGEIAGPLNFALKPGTNQTLQLSLSNGGNGTIVVTAALSGSLVPHGINATPPTVSLEGADIVVLPYSTNSVNVTVSLPYNDTNSTSWSGVLSAQCASNCTGGVAKLLTVSVT